MALFGWKKPQQPASTPQPGTAGGGSKSPTNGATPTAAAAGADTKSATKSASQTAIDFSPEKAQKWFNHARTVHDTGNYEFAMTSWLSGLRFEPNNMEAIQGFFKSAAGFREASGNKGKPPRDVEKAVSGRHPVERYLSAMLEWACKPTDPDLALKATLAPAELGLSEVAKWIAPKALDLAVQQDRPRKGNLIKLMEIFTKVELYEFAARAGEAAHRLDPSDNQLGADVRNLAAQATMTRGGYENTGVEGGFRQNIKDSNKQRMLDEEGRIVKSEETAQRVIDDLRVEHTSKPLDRPIIRRFVEALLARGTPADEQEALVVLDKAFADTQEFRFRQTAGEIRIKQGRRHLRSLKEAADKNPADSAAKTAFTAALHQQLELEIGEYESRVEAYPTDLTIKFELGLRYNEAGKYNEAIEQFQLAKADGKLKARVLFAMGRSFSAIDWDEEAIDTYRQALEGVSDADASSLDLRYDLMCALQKRATAERDVAMAEEAAGIASRIAQQQFGYKDIRTRREQIKGLIGQLKAGQNPAT